jgi:sarcosine oxidase subunit beta
MYWHHEAPARAEPPSLTHRSGARVTRHLYGRQTRAGEIIFGGDREIVGLDVTPDPAGIESNKKHAGEVLPLLGDLPVRRTWAGFMPFPLDGDPIIGRVPELAGCYIVTGLASSGFGRGPMAGRLVAEYVLTGHRPAVLGESDPARCVTLDGDRRPRTIRRTPAVRSPRRSP